MAVVVAVVDEAYAEVVAVAGVGVGVMEGVVSGDLSVAS